MKFFFPILIALAMGTQIWAHPIKMAVGKLSVNTAGKTLLLTLNFYIDDFEPVVQKLYPQPAFDFELPSETMSGSIVNYVNRHLALKFDGKRIALSVLHIKKIEDNVCQVSLVASLNGFEHFKTIAVSNSLLMETYRTQSNIVHVVIDNRSPLIWQFYQGDFERSANR